MRRPVLSLLAIVVWISASSDALSNLNGKVNEEHDVIVVEWEDFAEGYEDNQKFIEEDIIKFGKTPLGILPVNPRCALKEGGEGTCMSLKSCYPYFRFLPLAEEDSWLMGSYDTCFYDKPGGITAFGVCCNQSLPSEFERPVFDHESQVSFNGTESELAGSAGIVNGQEADPHQFPFIVALMNRERHFCGGSLIDEKHVLTAAHCVARMTRRDIRNFKVRVGEHNLRSTFHGQHVERRVKRVIRHKDFSYSTLQADVAILTLDEKVETWTSHGHRIIHLASDTGDSFEGHEVQAMGWGSLSDRWTSHPAILRKVKLKVWANERCRRSYGPYPPHKITKDMLCASEFNNKDTCEGDSGGPLIQYPCSPTWGPCLQLGIVSWGKGCGKEQYPGVYARITELLPWIRRIVREY